MSGLGVGAVAGVGGMEVSAEAPTAYPRDAGSDDVSFPGPSEVAPGCPILSRQADHEREVTGGC